MLFDSLSFVCATGGMPVLHDTNTRQANIAGKNEKRITQCLPHAAFVITDWPEIPILTVLRLDVSASDFIAFQTEDSHYQDMEPREEYASAICLTFCFNLHDLPSSGVICYMRLPVIHILMRVVHE